jgi:hypothetical protein
MVAAGCNVQVSSRVSGVDNTELDNGQPVRSRRREYGCGRKWRGGVMASYDRDTDNDEDQRSKELTVMGKEREKLSAQHFMFAITTKRSLATASVDPGCTSLLDSEVLKVMSTDQERIQDGSLLHIEFSRTLIAREKFLLPLLQLG